MLLAPHRLQRPNETQLNQHKPRRWLANRTAITKDMPGGDSATGTGIRLPAEQPQAGLPASAGPRHSRLAAEGSAQEGTAFAWLPSKPIQPQPAAARQPTPRPGCVQDLALMRIQSGAKDADRWSGCKSSSALTKQGRNRSTCSAGAGPLLEGGKGLLS